jgi:hypothetical protein
MRYHKIIGFNQHGVPCTHSLVLALCQVALACQPPAKRGYARLDGPVNIGQQSRSKGHRDPVRGRRQEATVSGDDR